MNIQVQKNIVNFLAEDLLTSREGLCSMEVIGQLVSLSVGRSVS